MDIKSILTSRVLCIDDKEILLVKHTEKAKHPTGIYGIPTGRI